MSTEAVYDAEAANLCLLSLLDLLFPQISLPCHTRSLDLADVVIWHFNAFQHHPIPPSTTNLLVHNQCKTNSNQSGTDKPASNFIFSLYLWIKCMSLVDLIKNLLQCSWVAFAGEISWSPPSSAVYRPSTFLHCVQTVGFSPLCTDRQLSSAVYRPSAFLHCV